MNNSNLPSKSELSENLTNVLRSAFSDKFPGALVTVLDALTPPSDPDLLIPDGSSPPLFFSDNPDENFPNIIGKFVDFLTTSSEPNIVASDDQEVKASWGRHGSDSLIGFDPAANHKGKLKIDVFTGDFTDEQLFGALTGQVDNSTRSQWPDRFILGDWQQPYYVEDETSNFGLNQFALITDFNPSQDIIQLHGTAQDYQLVDTDLGTAIFWRQDTGYDLVGLVGRVSNLNLESDYFDFKGNTPPAGPVIEKAEQIGTVGIDFLFASTVDAEGNLYVGGGTGGSLAGPNSGARDVWLSKYDNKGNQLWSKQFGTTGTETAWSMATDGSNIYIAGNTAGELGTTSQGGRDLYLAKYDSDGNQKWIKQFGTVTFDESFRVAADTSGNIYVGGHTVGGLAGQNQNVGQNLNTFGFPSTDSFVAKFDSNGNQVWIQQFGTVELDDDWGVAIDKDGNVFAGGNTKGNFGGQNAGFYDNWLVKLDKEDGHKEWVKQFGTSDYDFLWDLKTDSTGNLYATGYTLGDLGGENAGSSDIWLAKFDNDGNQLWIKQFGTSGDDAPFFDGLEVDSEDNIFLTGYTDSNLAGANAGSYDTWVAKYDKDGNQLWIKQFGTPDYDTATTISADSSGNVYVGGITDGSLGGINAGSYDAWVVKLDANGGIIQDFTGNSQNKVVFGGSQGDTITTGNGNDTIYGNGGEDILIAGDGDNLVFGGSQGDTITTGNGNDTIYANDGKNTVIAGDGNNVVFGGSQDDTITTGNGNDTIYGNGGEDILIAGNGDNLVFGGSQNDKIITGNGNDTIYANEGKNTVVAGDGNNIVFGGSQDDTITTGNGNDTIYANGGSDYINSKNGLDTIWLGAGNSTVVLQIGEGYDNVKNFKLGATKFQVSSLDNLSFSNSTEGAKIFQGSDLLAIVSWQNANTFSSNIDAIFVA